MATIRSYAITIKETETRLEVLFTVVDLTNAERAAAIRKVRQWDRVSASGARRYTIEVQDVATELVIVSAEIDEAQKGAAVAAPCGRDLEGGAERWPHHAGSIPGVRQRPVRFGRDARRQRRAAKWPVESLAEQGR